MHAPEGLGRALASLLANKLSSRTLLPMQLAGLFLQAYEEDEVGFFVPTWSSGQRRGSDEMMESGLWFSSASPLLSYKPGEVVALAGSSIAAEVMKFQMVTARFTKQVQELLEARAADRQAVMDWDASNMIPFVYSR